MSWLAYGDILCSTVIIDFARTSSHEVLLVSDNVDKTRLHSNWLQFMPIMMMSHTFEVSNLMQGVTSYLVMMIRSQNRDITVGRF